MGRAWCRLSEFDCNLGSYCAALKADPPLMVCDDLFHQAQTKACASAFWGDAVEGFENQFLMFGWYACPFVGHGDPPAG